jgi:hypothetical protein
MTSASSSRNSEDVLIFACLAIELVEGREEMKTRAKRGRPEDLRDILAQVPDAPPLPADEV